MPDVRALAAAYGIRVELAPLGDWGPVHLIAEYDPDGPTIRVNERALPPALPAGSSNGGDVVREAIERAVAHELYHHREAIGEVARIAGRREREAAADAFADELIGLRA